MKKPTAHDAKAFLLNPAARFRVRFGTDIAVADHRRMVNLIVPIQGRTGIFLVGLDMVVFENAFVIFQIAIGQLVDEKLAGLVSWVMAVRGRPCKARR